jgi:hypothetical protein
MSIKFWGLMSHLTLVALLTSACQPAATVAPTEPLTAPSVPGTATPVLPTATPVPPTAGPTPAGVSFADSGQQLGTTNSWDVQLVDINEDGVLEAYFEGAIWLNDGQGHFTKGDLSFGPPERQAWFADVNDDGHVDAICDNFVYINDGQGGFTEKKPVPSDIPMMYVELADLNDDGRIDIITAAETKDHVLFNDGAGDFDTGTTLGGWAQCRYAVGDINGDGFSDIYVAIPHTPPPDMSPATNLIWLGDGQGNFSDTQHDASVAQSRDVVMADFDGDGDLDLFVAAGVGFGKVFINDGQGNFTDSGQALNRGLHAADAQAADLDDDGDLDLFIANGSPLDNGQPDTVWLNDGNGQFEDSGLRLGNLNSLKVALGDLNGDGYIDAIVANVDLDTGNAPVQVWLNTTQKSEQ